ncbi:MAG TPA: hypothetical protein PLT35_06670, partial [Vicinamibacterales bacterium]|nr:hypothetical protein [Vicinamibacterales bacterium]
MHVVAPSTVTVVVRPVPVQRPPQPVKVWVASGAAVSVTVVAAGKVTEQAEPPAPQVSPPPVTVPPVGAGVIANPKATVGAKTAVQDLMPSTVTVVFGLVPLQAPPQPVKVWVASGAAVSVTVVAAGKVTEQAEPPAPQVSPPPVTVPPVGTGVIASWWVMLGVVPAGLKVALQVRAPVSARKRFAV